MYYLNQGKHTRAKALSMGYKEHPDGSAYGGAYYIKDDKKWIFNIPGLKKHLGVSSDDELRAMNYDVDVYWKIEKEVENSHMSNLYQDLQFEPGEPVYLEGGMYLYPDGSIR
ncbi:hypothetical protein CYR40_00130 [Chimaeribacter arupi]|uniref:hypothetical protein n=1 Tax=Chimaeribacter arupi TaxID=2060066 RepID=UPI000C7D79A7|nr:hypothetical protein [Chimaeribacter arupi]PLR50762.1 hypothetical protein CYR40_00130 [Chimaeribacter arupi]